MRKLKSSEIAFLVAGLTIGSGNLDADENPQVIATVTVTASRITINVSTAFVFSSGYVPYSTSPAVNGTIDSTLQAKYRHAIECAMVYGRTNGAVPKDNWVTYFADNYGWVSAPPEERVHATDTNQPPPEGTFTVLYGHTTHYHSAYPYIQGQSKIFLKSHNTTKELIDTVAHEWAHQWQAFGGGDEAAARAVGQRTAQAWENDGGSKCGGP